MWPGDESAETQQLFQPPADPLDLNLAAAVPDGARRAALWLDCDN